MSATCIRNAQGSHTARNYDYKDMQLTTLATINNAPGQFTTNAGQSTIFGVEVDTRFKLTPDLSLSAAYAYLNGEFDEYYNTDPRDPAPVFNPTDPAGLGRTDLSGRKIPYVAENTINLGLDYDISLGSAGMLNAALAFTWQDDLYLREYNHPRIDRVEAHTRTDFTLSYDVAETGLRLTGYVTNLEDDVHKNNVYVSPGFVGASATTAYTRPRTIGVRLDYEF